MNNPSGFADSCLFFWQLGGRKRRIKLVLDREYESGSTGEDSAPETQRPRVPAGLNSHANINGSVYVAQNGSIIRTRRSVSAPGPPHTNCSNNLKIPSPVFSSRLAKHFKKLDKMAATLEERVPMHSPGPEAGCRTARTFQGPGKGGPGTAADRNRTPAGVCAQRSDASIAAAAGAEGTGADPDLLRAPPLTADHPHGTSEWVGERESKVDGSGTDDDQGLIMRGSLGCPSDRTQSDEEELWMGPWSNLHIPMTKL